MSTREKHSHCSCNLHDHHAINLTVTRAVNCCLQSSKSFPVRPLSLGNVLQLAVDGNCTDEFKARKAQSERLAVQLSQSGASLVDAYMIYVFSYCPVVFYFIPITYFTPVQCRQIQSPFMNTLLPKLCINRHVKQAVIWGPSYYGGLDLKHMETKQIAKTVESLIGHVRANTPTGKTFVIACKTYQILLGVQQQFLSLALSIAHTDQLLRPVRLHTFGKCCRK